MARPYRMSSLRMKMRSRQVIVDKMRSWVGCHEGDSTHKHIVDLYNAHKPLPRGYKVKYTDSWCATTVSAAAIECGYTDIIPLECSCQQMIDLLKIMGIWMENDAYVPQPGDIIFYDWQDSGIGDNVGWSDHVGVVEKCDGNIIVAIEGNNKDGVNRRSIQVNGKYIRGYGVPRYDKEVVVSPAVKKGSYGIDISSYQKAIDFAKVKKAGIDFVILRSTTKNGKADPRFEEYWNGAKNAGLQIKGVYKLSYAHTTQDAQKEAEGVIKLLNGRKCDIWLDLENGGGQQIYSKDVIALIITSFLTTCVKAGYDVGIYCNMDWYQNHIKDDIKKICRFWIARYPKEENDDGTIHIDLKPNVKQVMWQYSSKGRVDGISTDVDRDITC